MTEKYYMSGIYTPALHLDHDMDRILPLVRELNYKYGLKVSSGLLDLGLFKGRRGVLMSYPSGLNVCAVWCGVGEKGEQRYFLYSPAVIKSRGADSDDRSTISGKTVGIITGLINKYKAIKNEDALLRNHMKVLNNMIGMIKNAEPITPRSCGRGQIDDDQFEQLVNFAAHYLNIRENTNSEPPLLDRTMIQKQCEGYEAVKKVKAKRLDRMNEILGGDVLMVGAYGIFDGLNTADVKSDSNGSSFVPGVAGIINMENLTHFDGLNTADVKIVKPFHPVLSFDQLLEVYEEAMPSLVMTKLRMEASGYGAYGAKLGFLCVADFYEECVPYATYYVSAMSPFTMVWLAIPIKREATVNAL